jgi:hypothetical protein
MRAGGHRGGVLVPHQHEPHFVLPLERREERHQRRAGIAVDVLHPHRGKESDDVIRDVQRCLRSAAPAAAGE